jgi:tetratricopeptide (TPR) repeat protein
MIKKIFRGISSGINSFIARVAPQTHSQFFFISLLIVATLSMIGFFPLFGVNGLFIKNLMLPVFAGALLIILAFQFLKNGSFTLIDKKTSWGLLGFLIAMLVSGIFAVASRNSLFGALGDIPSFSVLFSLAIIFFISSIAIKKFSHVLGLLVITCTTFFLAFLHVILRIIFGTGFLSFGFLNTLTSSIIGSWTDFGIFSLLVLVFAVICLEMGKFVKFAKWITIALGIMAVIGLFLVNMGWLWLLAGGLFLVIAIYMFSVAYWNSQKSAYDKARAIPWYSLVTFIFIILGLLLGNTLLGWVNRYRSINYQEVYPNIAATTHAGWVDIIQKPLTGVGLASFDYLWNTTKPVALSGTQAGSIEFSSGYSFVGTILATTGVLGILAVLVLVILSITRYYRVYRRGFSEMSERFTTIIVIAGSLVLSIIACVDYPGITVLVVWAMFMGALWGMFAETEEYQISFIHDPRTSFFGMMVVLLLIFIGGSFMYINIRKTASVIHYSRALYQSSQNNQNAAISELVRANQLWSMDFYNRSLASQVLLQVQNIKTDQNTNKEALSQEVQRILSIGLSYADVATKMDSKNYRNWVTLGNVYQFFNSLKVEGALEKTRSAYTTAQKLSPNDTTLDLLFADLDLTAGNSDSATKIVKASIAKYPTADAFTWLYRQDVLNKNYDQAEINLGNTIQLNQTNSQLLTELGTLFFVRGKYDAAATVFERSLAVNRLQPSVFAALGVSYESLGKPDQANQVFDFLKKQLPDNAQKLIDQARAQRGIVGSQVIAEPAPIPVSTNTTPLVQ